MLFKALDGGGGHHDDRTADEIISQDKQGSIRRRFPSEMLKKTRQEIEKIAKDKNNPLRRAAQTAKKLLTDGRFNKDA